MASDSREASASDPATPTATPRLPGVRRFGAGGRKATFAAAVGLFALAIATYAGTVGAGFPYDDEVQVARNRAIRDLERMPALLTAPTWPGYVYRPVATVSYALTHAVSGLDPWPFHLTNVVLHGLATVLVFLLLTRLFGFGIAAAAAALFAVLPIHVEAVASIANRTELFAAVFMLFSLLWLERSMAAGAGRSRVARLRDAGVVFGGSFLAMVSKESAFCLPALAILLLWLRRRQGHAVEGAALPLGAIVLASAAVLALRTSVLREMPSGMSLISLCDNPLIAAGTPERLARAASLLGRYALLAVAPLELSPDYSLGSTIWSASLLSPSALLGGAAFAALLAAIAFGWRREPRLAFFTLWFFVAFGLTANVLRPIGVGFAERLAYLPSLGICGLLAAALSRLTSSGVRRAAIAGLVLVFALRSVDYARVWHDTDTLFGYAIAVEPGSARIQNNRGDTLRREGKLADARLSYAAAARIAPALAAPWHGLALLDLAGGDTDAADGALQHALQVEPEHVASLVLLGRLRLAQGEPDAAGQLFVRALNLDNDHFGAKLGILAATLRKGNLSQAAALRAELERVEPGDPELRRLAQEMDALPTGPGAGAGARAAELDGAAAPCDAVAHCKTHTPLPPETGSGAHGAAAVQETIAHG
jgi:protein O-mannosyl-transferase